MHWQEVFDLLASGEVEKGVQCSHCDEKFAPNSVRKVFCGQLKQSKLPEEFLYVPIAHSSQVHTALASSGPS